MSDKTHDTGGAGGVGGDRQDRDTSNAAGTQTARAAFRLARASTWLPARRNQLPATSAGPRPGADTAPVADHLTGAQPPPGGDGAVGDRGAEQFGPGLRGAFLGQELSHVEVDDDRGDPRPVL